jgi:tRNA (guanine-N7-)-methyltransferase
VGEDRSHGPAERRGLIEERRRGLLYGRRKGPKLSPHQQHLRDTLLPTLALAPENGRDPRHYFSTSLQGGGESPIDDIWLETGYGAGEHLVWQAKAHPRIGLIGAEPYEAGTSKLLSKLAEESLPNIRLYEGDVRDVLDALPDASISRFFLLFPDPWPKTRHHKRRFIQMEMLDRLARILKSGAELRFASDDAGYLTYALERLMAHREFRWTAKGAADWHGRPADWPPTRYEAKRLHGPPAFLSFVRT